MNEHDIASLRREYSRERLDERSVQTDPFAQFASWFDEAMAANIPDPNAMSLSTASADAAPSARIVLLKGLENGGFVFFTNYNSSKGKDLAANPKANLLFFWSELERQVSISGRIQKIPAKDSDEYFESRPFESKIGALASAQSELLDSREELEKRYSMLIAEHKDSVVERPEHWGGYVLLPHSFEFWQGRPSRLHDRIRYRKADSSWIIERLSP